MSQTKTIGIRVISKLRKHHDKLLMLIAVIAPLSLVYDVLLGSKALFNKDIQLSFYPLKTYLRDRLAQGEFPLWTPDLGLGMPFFALPEAGSLYPLNLILLLPWPACVGQLLVVHLALAALGMYLLAKELKLRTEAAVFGAMVFSMGGYLLSMTSSSGIYAISVSWMPLIVFLSRRATARADFRSVAYFGLAVACQALNGEFQGCILTAVLVLALSLQGKKLLPALIRLAVGWTIGIVVALPQLVSTLSFLGSTRRATGTTFFEATGLSLHPMRIIETFVSGFLGNISNRFEYLGFYMNRIGSGWTVSPWSDSVYTGSVALAFLIFCAVGWRTRSDKRQITVALVGLASLLVALGEFTPFFYVYHQFFPLAYLFRYPEKLFSVTSFAVALLSAWGVSRWLDAPPKEGSRVGVLGSIWMILTGVIILVALLSSQIATHFASKQSWISVDTAIQIVRDGCILELAVLVLSGLVLYFVSKRRPQLKGAAVLCVIFCQLAFFNNRIVQTTDTDLYAKDNLVAMSLNEQQGTHPVRLLNSPFTPASYAGCLSSNDNREHAVWKQVTMMMNTGIMYGIGYYHSYVGMKSEEAKRFWKETKGMHREIMDLLSIPFGVFPLDYKTNKDQTLERILSREYPCLGIYKSKTTLEMARPVSRALPVNGIEDVLAKLKEPHVLSGDVAVIEGIPEVWKAKNIGESSFGTGLCESKPPTGRGFEATCTLSEPSFVVINVAFQPSMEATVDGKEVELKRAAGVVSAVWMPEGRHTVKLWHKEKYLGVAFAASVIILLLSLGIMVHELKKC